MISRLLVACVIVGLTAYDVIAFSTGVTTVSEAVRQLDKEVAGLLRWGLLALWAHWFIPFWYTG